MAQTTVPATSRAAYLVTGLRWVIVVFDGYDLIVYGTVLPRLLAEPGWDLTKSGAGLLGSLAFAGMLVGAVLAGTLADRLGRRRTIIACTVWFSVFTALCAAAPGPEVFGLLRLLAGLGLGGLVPSANALATEFVDARVRSVVATLMMSGVPIGGCLAALVGIWVLPGYGWPVMFLIALAALVVVVPVAWWLLPESPQWLRSRGRVAEAAAVEERYGLPVVGQAGDSAVRQPLRALVRAPYRRSTVLFSLATVVTLFAWFGLTTWLPQLMRESGFDLGSALGFLLALSLGAVLGSLVTAWAGTRIGPVRTGMIAAATASAGRVLLITHPPSAVVYGALVLAGVGTHGAQCLIIAAVATHYPAPLRGSALGFSLGFGRIGAVLAPQVGGWLPAAGLGVNANFLAFAVAAALAACLLAASR